jgi:hypothetical protein
MLFPAEIALYEMAENKQKNLHFKTIVSWALVNSLFCMGICGRNTADMLTCQFLANKLFFRISYLNHLELIIRPSIKSKLAIPSRTKTYFTTACIFTLMYPPPLPLLLLLLYFERSIQVHTF